MRVGLVAYKIAPLALQRAHNLFILAFAIQRSRYERLPPKLCPLGRLTRYRIKGRLGSMGQLEYALSDLGRPRPHHELERKYLGFIHKLEQEDHARLSPTFGHA